MKPLGTKRIKEFDFYVSSKAAEKSESSKVIESDISEDDLPCSEIDHETEELWVIELICRI